MERNFLILHHKNGTRRERWRPADSPVPEGPSPDGCMSRCQLYREVVIKYKAC